jgi:nitrate reductase beta subunit
MKPYGIYEGITIFEGAQKRFGPEGHQRALGYIPDDEEWRFPNIYEDTPVRTEGLDFVWDEKGVSLPEHRTWFFHLARLCNHCTYPSCLAACPREAIYKRPEDGIVLLDQKRCRGYRKCVEACPYKRPMFRGTTRISEKCIACYPRIEGKDPLSGGSPMETRCMAACVGKIRLQGLVKIKEDNSWAEDRYNPLYYLIKVEKVALPLYPQLGTEPNGYYIPPRVVPRAYSRQMFGPGADEAIEKYLAPSRELLAVLQLFRATQKIIYRYEIKEGKKVFETSINGKTWAMYNDTVIGYGHDGKEVVRTTVEEPIHVRKALHPNSI